MATQAATSDKKKRNAGPMIVTFADSKGKADHKRVVDDVNSVVVSDRKGKSKAYSLDAIPPQVRHQLVASALAARAKIYISNHVDDNESNVIDLADKVYADIVAGKMRAAKEGGKAPGRQFDPTDYIEAVRMAKQMQADSGVKGKDGKPIKPASKAQLDQLKTKLVAMPPKERTAEVKRITSNGLVASCLANIKAKRLNEAAKNSEAVDDLF